MISENSQNRVNPEEFREMAQYLGIALQSHNIKNTQSKLDFVDTEVFFLAATYHLNTSRIAEGFLCWLSAFGHLLSPSKIRRLIQNGHSFDSAMLGGFIEFMLEMNIKSSQWKIIKPYCKRNKKLKLLLEGPSPRSPAGYFLKYGILAPRFSIELSKFLLPINTIYKNCIELKNRALFGSIVNADVASYLKKHPNSSAYHIAKNTHHHKARVFEIYSDVLTTIS